MVSKFFSRLFGKKEVNAPMRDVSALVMPFAMPTVHVVRTDTPSLSHFGGCPGLPPEVAWPEKNGTKLGFLARLSLAAIHQSHPVAWLPKSGALLFFYDTEQQPWGFDPKDRGGWAVLLVPDIASPTEQHDDEPSGPESQLPHRNIAFRRIGILPSWDHDSIQQLNLTSEESDKFFDISEVPYEEMPKHQVSGSPAPVQGDTMELECQLASNGLYCGNPEGYKDPRVPSLTPGAANWRLLFQIDSDDDLGVMWGDCGTIYYWVEEQEARVGNFSNAWLVLQCT
jgi:uncharacterized protein YwqG